MNIIAISDIHGSLELLDSLGPLLIDADLLLIAGDITNFAGRSKAQSIITALKQYNPNILAVSGNCDLPAVDDYLTDDGINLHCRIVESSGLTFTGLSGCMSKRTILTHKPEEKRFAAALESIQQKLPAQPFVLVTHQPPFGAAVDEVSPGRHAGSKAIRDFIEANNPILALSGHIHEAPAIDKIENTMLINPGPLRQGRYAQITIENNTPTAELKFL